MGIKRRNNDGRMRRLTIDEIVSILPKDCLYTPVSYVDDHIQPCGKRSSRVLCRCKCGNLREVLVSNLQTVKSCGCRLAEITRKRCQVFFPVITSLYQRYAKMINRCYNPKDRGYKNYGGRGVRVCDEWRNSYQKFLDWALDSGWEKGLQLDKDIKGDGKLYSPETCIWVTRKENMQHTSRTVRFEFNGEMKTISEISEVVGVPYDKLYWRLNTCKMTMQEAITKGKIKSCNKKYRETHIAATKLTKNLK